MMRTVVSIAALALALPVLAQKTNLNPTVTVSNKYSQKLSQSEMIAGKTVVPDSLYRFDLDFDYKGFETQYKGTDAFNPIHTELDMSPRAYDGKRFNLTAGAGYAVPILFDMTAVLKQYGRFKIGMYASNDSFWGRYHNETLSQGELLPDGTTLIGYDSRTKAGFDARLDWRKSRLLFDVKYDGVHSDIHDRPCRNNYNSATASANFTFRSDKVFRMGVAAAYTFGAVNNGNRDACLNMIENVYKASLDFQFSVGHGHLLDLYSDFNMTDCFGGQAGNSFGGLNVSVSPLYYFFGSDKLFFGAGVSLLYSASLANVDRGDNALAGFPCLKFRWKAVRDCLVIYGDSSLDGELWGMGSNAKESLFYVPDTQKSIVKKYKSDLGFKGNFSGVFHYDLHAGYSNVQNAPLYLVTAPLPYSVPYIPTTSIYHEKNLRSIDAGASVLARFHGVSISADATYKYFIDRENMLVVPSDLEVSGDVKYDWNSRFSIHAGADYRSEYKSGACTVPWYVDLKAGMAFNFRKSVGVFLEGSNLLNHTCQPVPLYSKTGPQVILGIKLLY